MAKLVKPITYNRIRSTLYQCKFFTELDESVSSFLLLSHALPGKTQVVLKHNLHDHPWESVKV